MDLGGHRLWLPVCHINITANYLCIFLIVEFLGRRTRVSNMLAEVTGWPSGWPHAHRTLPAGVRTPVRRHLGGSGCYMSLWPSLHWGAPPRAVPHPLWAPPAKGLHLVPSEEAGSLIRHSHWMPGPPTPKGPAVHVALGPAHQAVPPKATAAQGVIWEVKPQDWMGLTAGNPSFCSPVAPTPHQPSTSGRHPLLLGVATAWERRAQ